MRQSACLVFNPIMVDNYAAIKREQMTACMSLECVCNSSLLGKQTGGTGKLGEPRETGQMKQFWDDLHSWKVLCLTLFGAYCLDFYLVASSPGSPMFNLHN